MEFQHDKSNNRNDCKFTESGDAKKIDIEVIQSNERK